MTPSILAFIRNQVEKSFLPSVFCSFPSLLFLPSLFSFPCDSPSREFYCFGTSLKARSARARKRIEERCGILSTHFFRRRGSGSPGDLPALAPGDALRRQVAGQVAKLPVRAPHRPRQHRAELVPLRQARARKKTERTLSVLGMLSGSSGSV